MSAVQEEVLFDVQGRAGVVTLNRPKALNAVTLTIVRAMREQLESWEKDESISHVIVTAAEGRAFSAGGDVRQLYDWGKAGDPIALTFYREEYRLNTYIKRYPKPYIALIDGIVMGGGVGISFHGSHRVAGDGMLFAMPETGIGLFPDVGGTYVLPRLPREMGMYLGLTGTRIGAGDALALGLATHAVPSDRFPGLAKALSQTRDIDTCIANFAVKPEAGKLSEHAGQIAEIFSAETLADVMSRLEGSSEPFAQKTLETLTAKSPTSLAITFRQLREGAKLSFEDCMQLEYRIVTRVLQENEFFEGVRAVIIDKDNAPNWTPASLSDIDQDVIDTYFAPLGAQELELP